MLVILSEVWSCCWSCLHCIESQRRGQGWQRSCPPSLRSWPTGSKSTPKTWSSDRQTAAGPQRWLTTSERTCWSSWGAAAISLSSSQLSSSPPAATLRKWRYIFWRQQYRQSFLHTWTLTSLKTSCAFIVWTPSPCVESLYFCLRSTTPMSSTWCWSFRRRHASTWRSSTAASSTAWILPGRLGAPYKSSFLRISSFHPARSWLRCFASSASSSRPTKVGSSCVIILSQSSGFSLFFLLLVFWDQAIKGAFLFYLFFGSSAWWLLSLGGEQEASELSGCDFISVEDWIWRWRADLCGRGSGSGGKNYVRTVLKWHNWEIKKIWRI